jgi:putative transcriptional regulator
MHEGSVQLSSFQKRRLWTLFWIVAAAAIVSAAAMHAPIRSLLNSPPSAPPAFIKPIASPGPQESTAKLARGKFLVAARDLIDPNFIETVVLLLTYDSKGAMGLIVNRETGVKLSELLPELEVVGQRDTAVFAGGPVSIDSLLLLVRSAETIESAEHLFEDVYTSASRALLDELTTRPDSRRYRAYAGYAGWGPGQLEREVETGSWRILSASAETVFDSSPGEVWQRLIRRAAVMFAKGGRPPADQI